MQDVDERRPPALITKTAARADADIPSAWDVTGAGFQWLSDDLVRQGRGGGERELVGLRLLASTTARR